MSKGSDDAAEENAAKSQPSGKWKPKINRSHFKNNPYMSELSDQKKPDVNGQNDSTENKMDSPKKTIISLKSVKNSSCDNMSKGKQSSTIIKLRKPLVNANNAKAGSSGATAGSSGATAGSSKATAGSSKATAGSSGATAGSSEAAVISSSTDSPKKKYTPIVWESSDKSASSVAPKNSSSEGSPKKKYKPITWP